jgi:FkbM family methyltransferase
MTEDKISPFVESDGVGVFISGLSTDPISQFHAKSGVFYELGALRNMVVRIERLSSKEREYWIVDAGANIGNHSLYIAGRLPACSVRSFEMNPLTYTFLRENVQTSGFSNIAIYNLGVSDRTAFCGVRQNNGNPLGGAQVDLASTDGNVELVTLDGFLENNAPPGRCVFMKLDVEGHEEQALKGATSFLARHRPVIYSELKDVSEFEKVNGLLMPLGYQPVYVEDDALPNITFCHVNDIGIIFSEAELETIRSRLFSRIVSGWQLHRTIRQLRKEISGLGGSGSV